MTPSLEQQINGNALEFAETNHEHPELIVVAKQAFEEGAKWAIEMMKDHKIDHCFGCLEFGLMFPPKGKEATAEAELCEKCAKGES